MLTLLVVAVFVCVFVFFTPCYLQTLQDPEAEALPEQEAVSPAPAPTKRQRFVHDDFTNEIKQGVAAFNSDHRKRCRITVYWTRYAIALNTYDSSTGAYKQAVTRC